MKKIKKVMKGIETAMMAAAFAEEGETGIAREVLKDERRIVLALRRDNLDNKAFRYALNTCKRIGADLDCISHLHTCSQALDAKSQSNHSPSSPILPELNFSKNALVVILCFFS